MSLPPRPSAVSVLVVRVSEIRNPSLLPITLDVSLAPCGTTKSWDPEPLSSLGVFPVDQPGSYAVPVGGALDRLRSKGVNELKDVCLQVAARHTRGRELSGPLEITLAELEWRREK